MLEFVSQAASSVVGLCSCGKTYEVTIPNGENPKRFRPYSMQCACCESHNMVKVYADEAFAEAPYEAVGGILE